MTVLKDYQCYVMYFLVGIITSIQSCVCHYGIFICLFILAGVGEIKMKPQVLYKFSGEKRHSERRQKWIRLMKREKAGHRK